MQQGNSLCIPIRTDPVPPVRMRFWQGCFLCLFTCGLACLAPALQAQEKLDFYIGAGMSLASNPLEKELEPASNATAYLFDFPYGRIGYTTTTAQKSYDLYDYTFNTYLKTEAYYTAWRFALGESANEGLYGLLGVGYFLSSFDLGQGIAPQSGYNWGLMSGLGLAMPIAETKLALEYDFYWAESRFHDIDVATGSNQLMISLQMGF